MKNLIDPKTFLDKNFQIFIVGMGVGLKKFESGKWKYTLTSINHEYSKQFSSVDDDPKQGPQIWADGCCQKRLSSLRHLPDHQRSESLQHQNKIRR